MNTATSNLSSSAEAVSSPEKVKVWDLPTRVFHWSLALSFTGAWLTAESERWRDIHVTLGYTLAGLIVFRLIWGLVGTRYARFSSFLFSPMQLVRYLKSLMGSTPEHHIGHNPGGALAIFALLALGATVAASGYATYAEVGGEWLEDLHEGAANAMLGVVLIHLAGVVVSSFLHKENLVRAMVTGWKVGPSGAGITQFHGWIGGLLLAVVLAFVTLAQTTSGQQFLAGGDTPSQDSNVAGDRGADKHADRQTDGRRKHKDRDDD